MEKATSKKTGRLAVVGGERALELFSRGKLGQKGYPMLWQAWFESICITIWQSQSLGLSPMISLTTRFPDFGTLRKNVRRKEWTSAL